MGLRALGLTDLLRGGLGLNPKSLNPTTPLNPKPLNP